MHLLIILFSAILLLQPQRVRCQLPVLKWAGSFLAANQFNPSTNSNGRTVGVDPQGNVYSAGQFNHTVDFDPGPGVSTLTAAGDFNTAIYITKQNPNGDLIWAEQLPVLLEFAFIELKVDQAGNVYLTSDFRHEADFDPGPGVYTLTPSGFKDAFVIKLNTNGGLVWVKQFAGIGTDVGSYGTSIELLQDGSIIACGSFVKTVDFDPGPNTFILSTIGNYEGYITKLDNNGNFAWAKKLGDAATIYPSVEILDVKADASGNIFTTGTFLGICDFDPGPGTYNLQGSGYSSGFVSKLTANGDFGWAKSIWGPNYDTYVQPRAIDLDANNNIYTTGTFAGLVDFDPGAGSTSIASYLNLLDAYLQKLDAQGNLIWVRQIGGDGNDVGADLVTDNDNNVYAAGIFYGTVDFDPGPGVSSMNNLYDESVMTKFDPNGDFMYAAPFRTIGGGFNLTRRMAIDPLKNIYITGYIAGSTDCDPGPGVYPVTSGGSLAPFVLKLARCTNITTAAITVSACSSYTLNNQTYTTSGIYTQTILNTTGCDSVITLNLTINRKFTAQAITICSGQSYFAGGALQTVTGVYVDTLLTQLGCDSVVTTTLQVNSAPEPDLGADRKLCLNGSAKITPGVFASYLWHNGSTQPDFSVAGIGTYWVKVTNGFGCSKTDSLKIIAVDTLPRQFMPADAGICPGSSMQIQVPGYKTYLWSTGENTAVIKVSKFGSYYLAVTDNNGCTGKDTFLLKKNANCIPISIPNAFTPNKDGLNDIFRPFITEDIASYRCTVFNRYGQKIFETDKYSAGWDGTFLGADQPNGSYVFWIRYANTSGVLSEHKGTVLLLR
jgi:gliding motility-associated-like protein